MIKKTTFLLGAAAIGFLAFHPGTAAAETVTTKTTVQQRDVPDVNQVDFSAFDVNKDGVYTMKEVGEKLFYVFDTDGNEVIDNIEFDNKNVMTIIPMKAETVVKLDYDSDGQVEEATYTYDTFLQESGLMRFDKDMDGLSAGEFVDEYFLTMDDNNNKAIELDEWKEAYIASRSPKSAEQERYNN